MKKNIVSVIESRDAKHNRTIRIEVRPPMGAKGRPQFKGPTQTLELTASEAMRLMATLMNTTILSSVVDAIRNEAPKYS